MMKPDDADLVDTVPSARTIHDGHITSFSRHRCSKGHMMSLLYKSPYDPDGVVCSKCDQVIKVNHGFYHCSIDEEDYHRLNCGDASHLSININDIEEEDKKDEFDD